MIYYKTDCGMETDGYKKDEGETMEIYLQKKLVNGKPKKDYKDFNMNKKCISCEQVRTKKEKYLNIDDGTTYKCEVKFCMAKKITLKQKFEELKRKHNGLIYAAKEIERLVRNGSIVNSLKADEKETHKAINNLRKYIKKE